MRVPNYNLAAPTSSSTVLGETGGVVKRFAVSDFALSGDLEASIGAGLIGFSDAGTYSAGTIGAYIQTVTASSAVDVASVLKTDGTHGNLPEGVAPTGSTTVGSPTISALTHTYLNSIGCDYAYTHATTASQQESYYKTFAPRVLRQGAWAAVSFFVYADNWDWVATGRIRAVLYPVTTGSQVLDLKAAYDEIDSTTRRFRSVVELGSAFATNQLNFAYLEVTTPAGRTATVRVTGYTIAFSEQQFNSVDWGDFDPYSTTEQDGRLTDVEARVEAIDGSTQTAPGLLVPSSFHVIQGRPLELYRNGLTEYREESGFDIAARCEVGTRPTIEYADPILRLDGNRFSGAGHIFAKRRYTDETTLWQKAVTFYSSAATKTGSPKILCIGDSLTQQGTVSEMAAKLTEAGVTQSFIGTKKEQGGLYAEGRSSYSTANFVFKIRHVNTNGSGQFYPVRTGTGSGATFTATVSGGQVTGITASGGSGYDDTPALPLVFSGGGGTAGYATVEITGGVPGTVTVATAGSGYTSAPTVTMPPDVTAYLALSEPDFATNELGPRWGYNPFLRPSTGADAAGIIYNGYVFDVRFYLDRFSFADPDIVFIALGTNDVLRQAATAAAQIVECIQVIYNQVRAALPTAKVAFIVNSLATVSGHGYCSGVIKEILDLYDGRESENIWILPAHAVVDGKFVYTTSVSATDSQTGVQTATISDNIHPGAIGRSQWAEMTFAFVMNRL